MNRDPLRHNILFLLRNGGDQVDEMTRSRMTHQEMVDLRDTAWTIRDLLTPYVRRPTWWDLRWPTYFARLADSIEGVCPS